MKLYCLGIGPGGEEQMTLRAVRARKNVTAWQATACTLI